MKIIEKYKLYKKQYPKQLVLIKDGIFYKTFYDDALIILYLFDYKYINNSISFGITPYEKVLSKLYKLDIGYVVFNQVNEILNVKLDEENYLSYISLSKKNYQKIIKNKGINKKLDKILKQSSNNYILVNNFLDEFLKSTFS